MRKASSGVRVVPISILSARYWSVKIMHIHSCNYNTVFISRHNNIHDDDDETLLLKL